MSFVAWKDKLKYLPLAAVFMAAFGVAALYLTGNAANVVGPENLVIFKEDKIVTKNGSCDFFSGKWVYDDVSYPLYKEGKCALMEGDFACERYGRKNLTYQNWRWQPHQCDLPKFNGTAMLEKIRNKRVVFVGDSLCRNQWRSFLCLVDPHPPPKVNLDGNFLNVFVKEYNATISFYWSPYLVESNGDDTLNHKKTNLRIIRLKNIENHGRHWIDADILIFESFVWWIAPDLTILWGSFNNISNAIYKHLEMSLRHYEVALSSWSDWLEFQVDRNKTKIFFMSASPLRLGSTVWGTSSSCYNSTEPIFDETYWADGVKRSLMEIVESTIEKLEERGVKVEYINITQLSGYRDDAHPSIYRPFWKLAMEDLNPTELSDCLHWCLPGVPDTWNQILYAHIMKP